MQKLSGYWRWYWHRNFCIFAAALMTLLERGKLNNVYNVATAQEIRFLDLALIIAMEIKPDEE